MLAKNGHHVGGRERICGRNRRVGMFSRKPQEDCSVAAPATAEGSPEESAGNKCRNNVCGNSFTPANRIHAFIGLRLEVNLLRRYAKRSGQRFPHFWKIRPQLRLLEDHHRVHVFDREFLLFKKLLGMFEEQQAVGALPLRIAIRKMRADISEPRRTKQRIAKRMRQHVAVRVPHRPLVERQLHPANDKLSPRFQPVQVVADAAARAHAFLRSSSRSAGRVIFILRSDPSTTCTSWPMRSTRPASSEAFTPSACARAKASFKSLVANACGVCASTTRSRGIVPVINATSSGKLARFTSLTVSMAGIPRMAAWQRRASSITRAICSVVTNGRTASCTSKISVSFGT